MIIHNRIDFNRVLIAAITHEQDIYKQIQKLVILIKIAHQKSWNDYKDDVFKTLIQIFLPYLKKMASKMYTFDPLIDRYNLSSKRNRVTGNTPILSEDLLSVIGILWELVIKYDSTRGVYFTYFMEKNFDWYYKNLCRKRISRRKYRDDSQDDYKVISYDELTDKKDEMHGRKNGIVKITDVKYDDNFDLITFEWSLKDPKEFVENHKSYEALSSFTKKQMEVFTLELEGYKQKQIADEIKKSGTRITQQGVQERLLGVKRKIDKLNN